MCAREVLSQEASKVRQTNASIPLYSTAEGLGNPLICVRHGLTHRQHILWQVGVGTRLNFDGTIVRPAGDEEPAAHYPRIPLAAGGSSGQCALRVGCLREGAEPHHRNRPPRLLARTAGPPPPTPPLRPHQEEVGFQTTNSHNFGVRQVRDMHKELEAVLRV